MFLIFLTLLKIVQILAIPCETKFTYLENYGNGFSVICTGNSVNLSETIVQNELTLSIVNSNIKNATSSLFHNFKRIKELVIKNSTFHFIANEPVFESFQQLEILKIQQTPVEISTNTFSGLDKLKELHLIDNNLTVIDVNVFNNTPNLKTLKVCENDVENLSDIPVCYLMANLKTLVLSANRIKQVDSNAFLCEFTDVIGFELNDFNHHVNSNVAKYMNTPSSPSTIDSIDLSFNEIPELHNVFELLENLKRINLESNRLTLIRNGDFGSLSALQMLNLRNNTITTIEKSAFQHTAKLIDLNLEYNNLSKLFLMQSTLLKNLNLAYNKFTCNSLANLNTLNSLRILNLSNNFLSDGCVEIFPNFLKVQELNLSNNKLKLVDGLFRNYFDLIWLNLANNRLSSLPNGIFHDAINVKYIDLSQNQIKLLNDATFASTIRLQTLNLSNNLLQNLQFTLVEPLKNLQVLDISGNQLHFIDYDVIFTNLPTLSIDIKSNLFTCDLLYKMINFYRKNGINYTINEQLQYDKENVYGIYCHSAKDVYFTDKLSKNGNSYKGGTSVVTILLICFGTFLTIVGLLFVIRKYFASNIGRVQLNEFELLT